MLNDEVFVSPESVFYDYQRKMEKQLCQVCHNLAVGFHYGAYVCEACKKFFKRYLLNRNVDNVGCKEECDLDRVGRRKCADCRYKKCLRVGMRLSMSTSSKTDFDISKIPCRICGSKSSGFHFGSLTCEGCKGFFRRADMIKDRLVCSSKQDCFINFNNRAMCKYCRYQQCLKVGMSKNGSRIGRQPNAVKYHCVLEITNCKIKAENTYALSECSLTDSLSDEITKYSASTNSPLKHQYVPSVLSDFQQPQIKAFYSRIVEAMDILHMPFQEAINLLQISWSPLQKNQTLVEVWNAMMQHFDVHSHMLIQFAKKIPVFNDLSLNDKRLLVQESMYPIILLNLARSYNVSEERFNYFDFNEFEYQIILEHFPCMHMIMTHVMNISRVVENLRLTDKQIGLFCVLELFKNYHHLESESSVHLFYQHTIRLCWASIIDQLMESGPGIKEESERLNILTELRTLQCPDDLVETIASKISKLDSQACLHKLRVIFLYFTQWLQKYNLEHQTIIDQLKNRHPELPYSELYTEMFQLTTSTSLFHQ